MAEYTEQEQITTKTLTPDIITKLAATDTDPNAIGNDMLNKGYDQNYVNEVVNQIQTSRNQTTNSQTPSNQNKEKKLTPDIVAKLSDTDTDSKAIGDDMLSKGYSEEHTNTVIQQIEAARKAKQINPQQEIADMELQAKNQVETQQADYTEQNTISDYSAEAYNINKQVQEPGTLASISEGMDLADILGIDPEPEVESDYTGDALQPEEYKNIDLDGTLSGIVSSMAESIEDTRKSLRRPDEIAAAIRNIQSNGSDQAYALASMAGSGAAYNKLARDHKSVNTLIVSALKANDIKVVDIAESEPIETADGSTNYGDIVYEDEKGVKHIVTESFVQSLVKSKFETVLAVGGGIASGAYTGAKLPATIPPWLKTLAIVGGGVVGGALAAATGKGIDMTINAWDTKQDLDNRMRFSKMVDAGVWDATYAVSLLGIGKTLKTTGKIINATVHGKRTIQEAHRLFTSWQRGERNAIKYIQDVTGHTNDEVKATVDRYNASRGTKLNRTNRQDQVKAYIELEPRLFANVVAAVEKEASSGLGLKKMLKKESDELVEAMKEGSKSTLAVQDITNRLNSYGKKTSRFFRNIEDIGTDLVEEGVVKGKPAYKFRLSEQLDTLMNRLKAKSNLDSEPLIKILDARIEEIKRLGSLKTSNLAKSEGAELLAGRKALLKKQKSSVRDIANVRKDVSKVTKDAEFLNDIAPVKQRIQETERGILDLEIDLRNAPDADRAGIIADIKDKRLSVKSDMNELKRLKNKKDLKISTEALVSIRGKNIEKRLTEKLTQDVAEEELDVAKAIAKTYETSDGGFADVLALRKALSALGRDKKLVGNADVTEAIIAMEKSVAKEIETVAKDYMGTSAESWLKNYTEARREWASYSRLKENDLYKSMVGTKAGYRELIDKGFKSMESSARAYSEVADRLTPAQRRGFEKALINKAYDGKIVKGAVEWTKLSNTLADMKLRTKDGQALREVVNKMSKNFGDMGKFGHVLESGRVAGDSTGIGESVVSKARQLMTNTYFKAIRAKIGITPKNKALALVDTMSDVLANPYKAKSIHKLIRETKDIVPEKTTWSITRQLQDVYKEFGTLQDYSGNAKIYIRTTDGKLPRKGGLRVASPIQAEAIGEGRIKALDVDPKTIKSEEEVRSILDREFTRSDLENPEVLYKLEENSVNGVEIDNVVYMLEHWEPIN